MKSLFQTRCGQAYFDYEADTSRVSEWDETHLKAS